MRQARYEILGIPIDMIVHNTLPRDSLITYMSRMKSNLHLGPGQIMRNALTRGITRGHLRRISSGLRFLAWIFIGLIVFMLSLNWKTNMLFLLWIAASVFFYFLFAAKSRDMMKPARYAILWTLQSHSIIRGFLLKPYKPESYPTDVIVVKNST